MAMATKAEQIIERFLKTETGRRLLEEADQEAIDAEKRKTTAAELAELKRTRPAVMAKLTEENDRAQRQIDAARGAFEQAKANFGRVSQENYGKQWAHDQAILEAESYLMRSAPAALKDALDNANERLKRLQRTSIDPKFFPDHPSAFNMSESDRPARSAIQDRVAELGGIEKEIEAIREQILRGE